MSVVLDAAKHLVHSYPGGATSLAPRLEKNATTLSHEVAGVGTAKLGLETAVMMTLLTDDMRILEAFARVCGRMTLPLPSVLLAGGDNVMGRLGDVLRESSDLVREVSQALADGSVNSNERKRIHREAGEQIAALSALLAEVDKRYAESNPEDAA